MRARGAHNEPFARFLQRLGARATSEEIAMPRRFSEAAGFLLGFAVALWLLLPLVATQ